MVESAYNAGDSGAIPVSIGPCESRMRQSPDLDAGGKAIISQKEEKQFAKPQEKSQRNSH